jgi:DNA (cytosine-5)-methyltransferase 1
MIKVGSDFSGVGAFNQALIRLGIEYDELFACDMDKYARQTFELNYGIPKDFPKDVYEREIPKESLDIYVSSPPCQAFSLAGKRKGEDDKRGILFYNTHEFIVKNKPRYFIIENVKGLLSDDSGKTFQRWIDYLAGKSVNGNPVIFPHEESAPYHVYYQVLNAKHYGVPQNRERIFIIGIRDDVDNNFHFPKPIHLTKRLKDVLEENVDEKYFLSDKMIEGLIKTENKSYINQNTQASQVFSEDGTSPNICAGTHGYANGYVETKIGSRMDDNFIKVKSATSKGYEIATENDSINFSVPNSETRRGRVGKGVAQTLDTACNQGIWIADYRADEGLRVRKDGLSPCMTSSMKDYPEWNSKAGTRNPPLIGYEEKIRRLTVRECFRLMDFNPEFKWNVSDSQAYRQAGNSIVVSCLVEIIKKLKL